jgi:hypothetical protein
MRERALIPPPRFSSAVHGQREHLAAIRLDRKMDVSTDWRALWIFGLIVAIALFVLLHLNGGTSHH